MGSIFEAFHAGYIPAIMLIAIATIIASSIIDTVNTGDAVDEEDEDEIGELPVDTDWPGAARD